MLWYRDSDGKIKPHSINVYYYSIIDSGDLGVIILNLLTKFCLF